ncbi:MAG TPA: peptidoglycan editing factor PgeF [Mycobacteriales bacterium]
MLRVAFPPHAAAAFTTRAEGNVATHVGDDPAAVDARRRAVAETLGVAGVAWCEQVHGNAVAVATGAATYPACAALVTTEPGLALAVMAADCVPVLLMADGAVGAAHAGRRGLVAGVVERTLAAVRERGAGDVRAVVGPAIGACCYAVGDDVAAEVTAALPVTRATTPDGRTSLDLVAGVREVLAREGVDATVVGGCTAHLPDLFFSYRRDGATGRHAGIVWRT